MRNKCMKWWGSYFFMFKEVSKLRHGTVTICYISLSYAIQAKPWVRAGQSLTWSDTKPQSSKWTAQTSWPLLNVWVHRTVSTSYHAQSLQAPQMASCYHDILKGVTVSGVYVSAALHLPSKTEALSSLTALHWTDWTPSTRMALISTCRAL